LIAKIGVICQDRNSFEFLAGLRDRLKCKAQLLEAPAVSGNTQRLHRRSAKNAWRYFHRLGVDLVVRFTDADGSRWQDVQRVERETVPDEARSIWICAVAVDRVEDWLCLDAGYLAARLSIRSSDLDPQNRTGIIKHTAARRRALGENEVVAQIVRDAPRGVFRRWLGDDSLRSFYAECRAAARTENCETPNELDEGGNGK